MSLLCRKTFLEELFNASFEDILENVTLNSMRIALMKNYFSGTV